MPTPHIAHPQAARWYRSWRFWLGVVVSLTLAVWAVRSLDWWQVWWALRNAHLGWVVLAVVTVLFTIAARVLRWRGLLLPQRFGMMMLLTALLAGQVTNYVVLSQLGIAVRAVALGRGNRARALGTVALEKLWDVVMLLGLIAALSVGLTLPKWLLLPTRLLAIGSTIALTLLLIVLLLRHRLSSVVSDLSLPIGRWLWALVDGLEGIVRLQTLLWGLLGSLVVWGLGAMTNYCILRAFDLVPNVAPALLLLAALQAGVAVPSLPGSVGVYEGIFIAVLALFDIGHEQALAAALTHHAVVFVPPILLGGILMWRAGYRLGERPDLSSFQPQGSPPSSISNPQPPTSNLQPPISVVIPAYNSADTLPACLQALQAQTFPSDRYEIIVVDDGSTDRTAEIAQQHGVKLIHQPNAGPAAARNRAAQAARGEILLFTDADCEPFPDWIERMLEPFHNPQVMGAKGVYRTRQRELVARFVQLEYEDRYARMSRYDHIDFVDTYSAAYRRDLFVANGGFDVRFPTASVEDQEFSFRLARQGHRLVFVPQGTVYHRHDTTLGEYWQRKFRIGYWKALLLQWHPDRAVRDSHTPQILKVQMGLAGVGAVLILGGVVVKELWVAGLLTWAMLLASGLPFMIKLLRRDPPVVLIAPLMLFVRAWALGLGLVWGVARPPARQWKDGGTTLREQ
jgi:glycosyltransferase involved in cell wall biosynthesis/uncharacterized membrane protein YbhN (UPF0104 family)